MDAREPTRLTPPDPPAIMPGAPNSYGPALHNNPVVIPSSTGMMQGMCLSFNSVASSPSKPADSANVLYRGDASNPIGGINISEPTKKKGRPRKYGPDGTMSLALMPLSSTSGHSAAQSSEPSAKKRGRPPGSGKKQQLEALASMGTAFVPHIITVNAGEDVSSKIMAFSQQGSRTVCILSANGVVCNVSLRQPATSGGTITYEGCFEIISLSGSFLLTEDGGTRSRTGGLSVALAGSDGRVLGGGVAGMLVAASPVQIVVASFNAEGKKSKQNPVKHNPSPAPPPQLTGLGGPLPIGSPPSQGTVSEASSEDDGNVDHDNDAGSLQNPPGSGNCNDSNSTQHFQNIPPFTSISWAQPPNFHRHDRH